MLIIRPRIRDFSVITNDGLITLAAIAIFIAATILIAYLVSRYASEKYNGSKKKSAWLFIGISVAFAILLMYFFGFAAASVKGLIFCLTLVLCSYSDVKVRECDDFLSVMILVAAFIGTKISELPGMLVSGLLVAGIFLLVAMFSKNGIGGADIKIAAASAFLLGFKKGVAGLLLGLVTAIIINLFRKKDKRKDSFPLVPYMTAGFLAAYFI